MPGLIKTNSTQAISNDRDGREFDEISDAVDEGWCITLEERGPRHLTLYLYPIVNVQMLKLWDDESEFDANKNKARFRQYEDACDRVKNFYKEQHGTTLRLIFCHSPGSLGNHYCIEKQTVEFNIQARVNFKSRRRARMGIWEAMEMLNTLVDESDPDVSLYYDTYLS